MDFESLFNQPTPELELLQQLAKVLQFEFDEYQNRVYFLKLEKVSKETSQFIWAKDFANEKEFNDYRWQRKYHEAGVQISFENTYYKLGCRGFQGYFNIRVYREAIETIYANRIDYDPEGVELPPRDLIENGFADLKSQLGEALRKKSG